jgi:hypothetical protein
VQKVLSSEQLSALQVDSHWGQLMSLFERADMIPILSSFLIANNYAHKVSVAWVAWVASVACVVCVVCVCVVSGLEVL